MKRALFPLGGAALAVGLLATCLAGTAQAADVWADDPMTAAGADALAVVDFWASAGNAALVRAVPVDGEWNAPAMTPGGDYTPDGAPGTVAGAHEVGYVPDTGGTTQTRLPRTIGKVFFLDHEGRERWCSATSVHSAHRNVVSTAAHCVHNPAAGGQVMGKWVFVPGYYQGKAPWGIYVGKQAWTHRDFDTVKDHDRDYAFVNVHNGVRLTGTAQATQAEYDAHTGSKWIQNGRYHIAAAQDTGRLGDAVGGQGLAWNQQDVDRTIYAFAYPAGPNPDGSRPYTGVTPKWSYGRVSRNAYTSPARGIQEHMTLKSGFTPGADGGPFLERYSNAERLGYVNGVVSVFADQDRNGRYDLITSAYFDGETAAVYQKAAEVSSGPVTG
ncbi:trypsin-like serine peptidase [Planomonospora venezuelensis]|uniref:V8-like Glu-specific endopeptidase n=1 Tax=Planomonospora venezuelensis TaxID=1999 RepID=A0A841CZQ5_PLAVE|nr:hypothetical protein [Planomonospora venezuelensis]MBB5961467.1 hypothetical protein [Planomonospora venezuelensis]GIN01799.1 peptidase [Planomonospora venezuelensis]